MTKHLGLFCALVLLLGLGAACSPSQPQPSSTRSASDTSTSARQDASGTAAPDTAALPTLADSLLGLIARQQWDALARSVHPEHGLRFSPYGYVDSSDVVLPPASVATLEQSTQERTWGRHDGSGEPIRITFDQYYDRFVYDRSYRSARQGGVNEALGTGNTINNILTFFGPEAAYVEYHTPGTEQYDGMDWRSLRLVFVPNAQHQWRLAGLVHAEWTI